MPKIFSNIVLLLGVAMSKSCANAPRGPLGCRLRASGASNATVVTKRHAREGSPGVRRRQGLAAGRHGGRGEFAGPGVWDTENSMARPLLVMRSRCKYRQNIGGAPWAPALREHSSQVAPRSRPS